MFFFNFKKLFLTSVHQNDLKTQKKNNLKQKNKKNLNFFKNIFKTQKQTGTRTLVTFSSMSSPYYFKTW
jgi:beta-glucosidase/6-phospho-beta-glucosidase/beta-galactosidase